MLTRVPYNFVCGTVALHALFEPCGNDDDDNTRGSTCTSASQTQLNAGFLSYYIIVIKYKNVI